jgi:hypothetical protein
MVPGCPSGDKSKIVAKTTIFLDIDVKREKGKPSTDKQLEKALGKAEQLGSLPIFKDLGISVWIV